MPGRQIGSGCRLSNPVCLLAPVRRAKRSEKHGNEKATHEKRNFISRKNTWKPKDQVIEEKEEERKREESHLHCRNVLAN